MSSAEDMTAPLILVVDDDWMNREMMQAYLERSGFRVALAHDAESALQKAADMVPSLIMLDVRMGDRDGFEVCQELKSRPETAVVPVVMLSALSNDDTRIRARAVGAADFITKTMNLAGLVAQIRALLDMTP
jgi:DNA-binding response OmpR family regulator